MSRKLAGIGLMILVLVGCARTEYLNADECAAFARVLTGVNAVGGTVDLERCNRDIAPLSIGCWP
jgi:hypothetical protein